MKIGVVSDTHSGDLPHQMINEFTKVDLIIHAGDFCTVDDLKVFRDLNKVKAVYGNMDDAALRKIFPEKTILNLEGVRVGLYHGEGSAASVLDCVQLRFEDEKVDAVIFGHSHIPCNKKIKDVLYFNPGSPNDFVRAPYCSYGILEIEGKAIKGKIVKVK